MRLSQQVYYGICGVFDLAYNGHDSPVQVKVIGDRQGVPTRYLEQIFQRLRKAGLVTGKRGPGGGYVLGRAPAQITLLDIVEALEGSVIEAIVPPPADANTPGDAHRPDFLWRALGADFAELLGRTSVEDLVRAAARNAIPRSGLEDLTYQI